MRAAAELQVDVRLLDPGEIHPWDKNPRKRFRAEAMAALRESVREDGVMQPILVRPRPEGGFLIVAGERRWRVSAELGEPVPAYVREMTDEKALELACFENLTREDLDPEEEADALRSLLGILSWEEVSARTGKSFPTIQRSLRLLEAPRTVLDAVAEGRIKASVASAVGALQGDGLREQAAQRVLALVEEAETEGKKVRTTQMVRTVVGEFSLRLKGAPFDPEDATLAPEAGAAGSCAGCRSNSSTLREYATGKSACCLDQGCFRAKEGAHRARVLAELAEEGFAVLSDPEAEAAADWASPMVRLDAEIPSGDLKPMALAKRKVWKWERLAWAKDGSGALVPVSAHLAAGQREPVFFADRRHLVTAARDLHGLDIFRTRAVSSRAVDEHAAKAAKAADEKNLHALLNAVTRAVLGDATGHRLRACRHDLFESMVGVCDPWALAFFTVRLGEDPAEVSADDDRRSRVLARYLTAQPLAQDCLFHEMLLVLVAALSTAGALSESEPARSVLRVAGEQ